MSLPLSVTVITLNEARNLARCLASVRALAAEIVVVDSGSTDATHAIAARFGARFVHHAWPGNVAQNAYAMSLCMHPWVLSLDADEALTPELATEIRQALTAGSEGVDGFVLTRRTQYLGEWIWHVWYPERRLRLVRRAAARWVGPDPHGRVEVTGRTQRLKHDFLHYTYRDLDDQYRKLVSYAHSSARERYARGTRMNPIKLLLSPWFRFLRDLILKGAWRDGWRGVLIAYAGAFSSFLKQAYLYELERATHSPGAEQDGADQSPDQRA